jgi:hypothetical protein
MFRRPFLWMRCSVLVGSSRLPRRGAMAFPRPTPALLSRSRIRLSDFVVSDTGERGRSRDECLGLLGDPLRHDEWWNIRTLGKGEHEETRKHVDRARSRVTPCGLHVPCTLLFPVSRTCGDLSVRRPCTFDAFHRDRPDKTASAESFLLLLQYRSRLLCTSIRLVSCTDIGVERVAFSDARNLFDTTFTVRVHAQIHLSLRRYCIRQRHHRI